MTSTHPDLFNLDEQPQTRETLVMAACALDNRSLRFDPLIAPHAYDAAAQKTDYAFTRSDLGSYHGASCARAG